MGTRARDARARRRARRDEGRRVGTGTPIRRGLVGGERRAPASIASRRPTVVRARVDVRRRAFSSSAAEAGSRTRGRTGRVIAPRVRLLQARDERGFEPGRVQPLRRERLAQLRDGHLPRRHRGPFGGAVASATRPGERGREEPLLGGARNHARLPREWRRVRGRRRDVGFVDWALVAKKKAVQCSHKNQRVLAPHRHGNPTAPTTERKKRAFVRAERPSSKGRKQNSVTLRTIS